ncbi:hypothetical protein G6F24_016279 [Rhizopus arrhizus]|nr:hypothetical protein G6F24_016279 [Rhizopus arrhizus]
MGCARWGRCCCICRPRAAPIKPPAVAGGRRYTGRTIAIAAPGRRLRPRSAERATGFRARRPGGAGPQACPTVRAVRAGCRFRSARTASAPSGHGVTGARSADPAGPLPYRTPASAARVPAQASPDCLRPRGNAP